MPGRELLIAEHQLGARAVQDLVQLLDLPFADPELRVGLGAALDDPADGLGTRGVGERRQFVEVGLHDAGADTDEHGALVLDRAPGRGDR